MLHYSAAPPFLFFGFEGEEGRRRGQTTDTLGEEGKGEDAQQTFNGESKQGVQ